MIMGKESNLRRPRVLLADDHEVLRNLVADLLATEFEVVGAVRDGQAAVDAARRLNPDVVVLDISMPVLGGIEAARQLKGADSGPEIVFLTTHDEPTLLSAALATGALGFVLKLHLDAELPAAIKAAMKHREFVSPCIVGQHEP
jgi:DNA-binding NarL/FixJ family response regulator